MDRAHMAQQAIIDHDAREQNRELDYQQLQFIVCGSMDGTSNQPVSIP
jgi:hypothetical protein